MFEIITLVSRLFNEGDVAAISAAMPTLQADVVALGDDFVRLGNRLKKIAADCSPVISAAHKLHSTGAVTASPGPGDTGPGFKF